MSELVLREASRKDVDAIVALHVAAFEGFFLTRLGPRFLSSYYSEASNLSEGCCYVVRREDSSELLGFVVGSPSPGSFYRRLLFAKWYRFALPALGYVLKNPSSLRKILRAFTQPKRSETTSDTGTIFSIAVAPAAQGLGVGKILVNGFADAMRDLGLRAVRLETDGENNDTVNRFYQKLGFVCSRQYYATGGRHMNDYVLDLQRTSNTVPDEPS